MIEMANSQIPFGDTHIRILQQKILFLLNQWGIDKILPRKDFIDLTDDIAMRINENCSLKKELDELQKIYDVILTKINLHNKSKIILTDKSIENIIECFGIFISVLA
jgi:hypothetical protein